MPPPPQALGPATPPPPPEPAAPTPPRADTPPPPPPRWAKQPDAAEAEPPTPSRAETPPPPRWAEQADTPPPQSEEAEEQPGAAPWAQQWRWARKDGHGWEFQVTTWAHDSPEPQTIWWREPLRTEEDGEEDPQVVEGRRALTPPPPNMRDPRMRMRAWAAVPKREWPRAVRREVGRARHGPSRLVRTRGRRYRVRWNQDGVRVLEERGVSGEGGN
ncbi:hypothetical protein KR018_011597 [Drosophila ironensis]|nr:hypothetical protein KR018_011597 [Drosophila ironensis]